MGLIQNIRPKIWTFWIFPERPCENLTNRSFVYGNMKNEHIAVNILFNIKF